jgi:hypothetical protein
MSFRNSNFLRSVTYCVPVLRAFETPTGPCVTPSLAGTPPVMSFLVIFLSPQDLDWAMHTSFRNLYNSSSSYHMTLLVKILKTIVKCTPPPQRACARQTQWAIHNIRGRCTSICEACDPALMQRPNISIGSPYPEAGQQDFSREL